MDFEVCKAFVVLKLLLCRHAVLSDQTKFQCGHTLDSGWTKMEAIDSLMRKAGYNGTITETQRKRIRLTRYQSTLFTMHYSEYASYVKTTRGAAPTIAGVKPGN